MKTKWMHIWKNLERLLVRAGCDIVLDVGLLTVYIWIENATNLHCEM